MVYPVAYRQTASRPEISGFQRKLPDSAKILHFPRTRLEATQLLNSIMNSPNINTRGVGIVGSMSPNEEQWFKRPKEFRGLGPVIRPHYPPFGLAQRQEFRRQAFGAIKGGLKIRSLIFREIARYIVQHLGDIIRLPHRTYNPGTAKHPLWSVSAGGRWGLYPFCSDQTGAHTVGSTPIHSSGPLVFGHPNGAFAWSEYDSVWTIENPVTHAISWLFTVVGRGNQNAGPDASVFYGAMKPRIEPNPWAPQYNPSWNRLPNRWPNNVHRPLPIPEWLDPFSAPPRQEPRGLPNMPTPFPLIPHLRPNPNRAPSERSVRGNFPQIIGEPTGKPDIGGDPFGQPETRPPDVHVETRGRWRTTTMGKQRAAPYRDKPPPKRTKELKARMMGFRGSLAYRFFNRLTEYQDYVDAIHKTLDRRYVTRGKLRVNDKALDIYRNLDKIDLERAVKALIANEIQDLLFGLLGKVSARVAGKIGSPVDLHGRAMRKGQGQTRDAVNELVADIMEKVFQ